MPETPEEREALARRVAERIARELAEDLARLRARVVPPAETVLPAASVLAREPGASAGGAAPEETERTTEDGETRAA